MFEARPAASAAALLIRLRLAPCQAGCPPRFTLFLTWWDRSALRSWTALGRETITRCSEMPDLLVLPRWSAAQLDVPVPVLCLLPLRCTRWGHVEPNGDQVLIKGPCSACLQLLQLLC